MKTYGKKVWLIPDTYLQSVSKNDSLSHEAICVVNTSEEDAKISFTFFYEDRDPDESYSSFCAARRTHHIRMDKLTNSDGKPVKRDVPYAVLIESSVPVVVQYSRLDTSEAELALMTTIAYGVE
ncbi:MAG: sensory rhodopsin transducer [Firmicutes bacterium]|nr:sensory rhodopsin transducer [Bacillota bacterium]